MMPGDRVTDAALMQQVAAGDQAACRCLVDAHLVWMVGLAFRMLGDMAAAEDVTQEAFLRLWRQARRWRPQAKVSTWLYQVIYNLCIDQLRYRQWEADEEAPDRADTAAGPMTLQHRGQIAEIVEAALAALPTRQRTAITLVHLQEVSNMEAAHIMGVSVEALESLLARGRRTLRKHLESRKLDLLEDV